MERTGKAYGQGLAGEAAPGGEAGPGQGQAGHLSRNRGGAGKILKGKGLQLAHADFARYTVNY